MACAPPSDTVWVGFMNTIPVIGKEKLMVEWILAYYQQNKPALIKKERELERILGESVEEHMEKLAVTTKPGKDFPGVAEVKEVDLLDYVAHAKGASENKAEKIKKVEAIFRDPMWVACLIPAPVLVSLMQKELRRWTGDLQEEELSDYLTCGKVVTGKPPTKEKEKEKENQREKAAREKKLKEAKEDIESKMKAIKPDYKMNEPLLETKKRSKRGEHVFNNNILKFHKGVVKDFINADQVMCETLDGHTLDDEAAEEVEMKMKVHFDEEEFYVNANSILYGFFSGALRSALLDIMRTSDPEPNNNQISRANNIIDNMNNLEIYVDHLAKEKWMKTVRVREADARFQRVKTQVVTMYRDKRGVDWCTEIRKKYRSSRERQ